MTMNGCVCLLGANNVVAMVSCRLRAIIYQVTDNYKRVVTLQISINTAINYTACYSQLIFYL